MVLVAAGSGAEDSVLLGSCFNGPGSAMAVADDDAIRHVVAEAADGEGGEDSYADEDFEDDAYADNFE